MNFKSQKQFVIIKILIGITPFFIAIMFNVFGMRILPVIENSLFIVPFLGILMFEYSNNVLGTISMKEKLKTDKSYKRKTLLYLLILLFLLGIQILRALR